MTLPEAQRALNGRGTDKIYLFGSELFSGSFVIAYDARQNALQSVESVCRRVPNSPNISTQSQPSRSLSVGADAQQCREWLQAAGLRFSMPRLKAGEALCSANDETGVLAHELHRQLSDAGDPLSPVSVRQVLRRMEGNGLVQATGRSRYRLSAPD